jgi:hypothetical protein
MPLFIPDCTSNGCDRLRGCLVEYEIADGPVPPGGDFLKILSIAYASTFQFGKMRYEDDPLGAYPGQVQKHGILGPVFLDIPPLILKVCSCQREAYGEFLVQDILNETVECFRYRAGYLQVGLEFSLQPRLVPFLEYVCLYQQGWNKRDKQHKNKLALNALPEFCFVVF